jgi:hypothetical protein
VLSGKTKAVGQSDQHSENPAFTGCGNKRQSERHRVYSTIMINDGVPPRGGYLHDTSTGGVSVTYPDDMEISSTDALEIGQTLFLCFAGNGHKAVLPSVIVRVFDGGFACKYDFTKSLPDQRFEDYTLAGSQVETL